MLQRATGGIAGPIIDFGASITAARAADFSEEQLARKSPGHSEGGGTRGRCAHFSCDTLRAGGRRLPGAGAGAYSQGAARRHAERHSGVGVR